ncbi:glycoside hydrolase family 43 protein [Actinomadura barringtoniae]|uniref:Glycoside hydrolase family 43 protein n=1 Tax=Actinomadura barringtoniae TaxID=1427535 RepID=A0A939T4Y1_9ACTN|nr:glycoside hydrolase family 43 protein [Actinomadura barringtoniae]MBO2448839.1 glycoside hydrolase family 43 protein [Actinomadura barringtoniae]
MTTVRDPNLPAFRNPILSGFHPDPSICRVEDDYYLVTSSFEWFPGLPIFHSRDLVHWRPLGHVLDHPSQLPLDGVKASKGLYAPTIRFHDGTFYVVCTLVDGTSWSGHFVVTATDPAGPWSEPHPLEGGDIDPSLFFDDDGRAWLTATRQVSGRHEGATEVWLREFDPAKLRLTGPEHVIWDGAVKGAVWPEGPHLYKIDGRYHLITAEGGTAHDHAVVSARADRVTGPYEGCPRNPVLTHRHLGLDHPITAVGHADLVRTPGGDWWMTLLAMRPYGGYFSNLGRETFLVPVRWEDGWPVAGPVEPSAAAPRLPEHPWPAEPACDHFDAAELGPYWNVLRTPRERWWSLTDRPGHLRLRVRPESLAGDGNPSFVARRQQHRDFAAFTALDFTPGGENECAGLALIQNPGFHVLFVLTTGGLRLVRREGGTDTTLAEHPVPPGPLYLGVEARGQSYEMRFAVQPGRWQRLGDPVDGRLLSPEVAGGFTGACIGMYASSLGRPSMSVADFDWFEYSGIQL